MNVNAINETTLLKLINTFLNSYSLRWFGGDVAEDTVVSGPSTDGSASNASSGDPEAIDIMGG